MSKHLIIYNPIAGKGHAAKVAPLIEKRLTELGVEYTLVRTEKVGHGIELARNAALMGFDVVVAAGGDGTTNEVINGLMQAKDKGHKPPTMAVLPVGRGNDFAFSMGIPTTWEEACQVLADANAQPLDIGISRGEYYPDGRYFGNGVGVGFDAVVGFVAAKSKLSGMLSYLVAAMKTMYIYFKAPTVDITLDKETITVSALMVSIMNGRRMGGSFMMAPESVMGDGLLDLCIVSEVSRGKILPLIVKFMKGSQADDPAVRMVRSSHVTVTAVKGTLPAHGDGETLCEEGHQLRIELLPQQLQLITLKK